MLFHIVLLIITGLSIAFGSWAVIRQQRQARQQGKQVELLNNQIKDSHWQLAEQEKEYVKGLEALRVAQKGMDEKQQALEFTNQKMLANEQVLIKAYNQLKEGKEEIRYQKNMLEETFEELQMKNNRLTDSISYAKRIQQAILPNHIEIKKAFEDAFIMFLPKDVVSGDFYWFSQIDNKTLIATVDCTGHGVPGAFMSMIGHTLLNQIVREKKILEPSEILETLDTDIYTSLRQKESKNIDGMDLSLCCIETPMGSTQLKKPDETVKVVFCGAKSTIYYSHQGEIMKKRGDRRPLGGWLQRSKHPFTNQVLELNRGDMVYLITDGYTDAANPNRRHFGTTKLMKVMEEAQNYPVDQQKDYFEKSLQNHQKGTEQRDDITFIGFRL